MCEKRTRKIKKGSHINRLRGARRIQRLPIIPSPDTTSDESNSSPPVMPQPPIMIDRVTQQRVILALAWRTIALMHKNKLIQQKIIDLQKETSEFVASVMKNPQNGQQPMRLFGADQGQVQMQGIIENNMALKVEPKVEII